MEDTDTGDHFGPAALARDLVARAEAIGRSAGMTAAEKRALAERVRAALVGAE